MWLQLRERIAGLSMNRVVRDAIKLTDPTRRGRTGSIGRGIWPALQLASPPTAGPVKTIDTADEDGAKAGCRWQVLVVDDEPMLAAMFKIVLESSGHQVTTVPDAPKALAALMEQDFDLAVIDLTLPEIDGWEVCRRINRFYPGIPVILTSGRAISMSAVRQHGACVSAVLSKPFDMQELLDAIGEAIAIAKDAVAGSGLSHIDQ